MDIKSRNNVDRENNAIANPSMQDYTARLKTFVNWNVRAEASPCDFAAAGFYYLGQSDRTKCFNCGGGLQNWEVDDDPWEEHAKHYPACPHILKSKDAQFVSWIHDTVMRFDNMVTREMKSNAVKCTLSMGIETALVEKCVKRLLASQNKVVSFERLIDLCLEAESESKDIEEIGELEGMFKQKVHLEEASEKCYATIEQQHLQPFKRKCPLCKRDFDRSNPLCKLCMIEERNSIFMPCKHCCCCHECASDLKRCPICKTAIADIIPFRY